MTLQRGQFLLPTLLALIHALDDDMGPVDPYWYIQEQRGRVLTGVHKEWAEAYVASQVGTKKYQRHLCEAGRLGNGHALLDLAEGFDDPAFFELPRRDDLKLRDYPTLGHIIGFVTSQRPELASVEAPTSTTTPAPSAPTAPARCHRNWLSSGITSCTFPASPRRSRSSRLVRM